jgi:predicted alpha/beta-fold hydrolase
MPGAMCRYSDVQAYYTDGSSAQYIRQIRTPTLYISSQDDPFLGKLPIEEVGPNLGPCPRSGACWSPTFVMSRVE